MTNIPEREDDWNLGWDAALEKQRRDMTGERFFHELLGICGITLPPGTEVTKVTFKTDFTGDIRTAVVTCLLAGGRQGKLRFTLCRLNADDLFDS